MAEQDSSLVQVDRAISRMNRDQLAATIQLSAKLIAFDTALCGHGQVNVDMPVAGVKIQIGGQIFWKLQANAAIASVQRPFLSKG